MLENPVLYFLSLLSVKPDGGISRRERTQIGQPSDADLAAPTLRLPPCWRGAVRNDFHRRLRIFLRLITGFPLAVDRACHHESNTAGSRWVVSATGLLLAVVMFNLGQNLGKKSLIAVFGSLFVPIACGLPGLFGGPVEGGSHLED
jgi:hypothetical protein